ncbi:hypothetical protein MMA231_01383 [Asticcacaulis sp. MM231]|uniref:hypothetical protein n=1 Tax=Asticcacaulis sp. MM231 TaxID=3157666 RepID=UPI0032D58064
MDISAFQPIEAITADTPEEADRLRGLAVEALDYIQSFVWCPPLRQVLLAYGIDGVIGLFLVRFAEPAGGVDDALWVVSGDVPPAYFVTDEAPTPLEALTTYCDLMDGWVEAVLDDGDLDEAFPVNLTPTPEHAVALRAQLGFIRQLVSNQSLHGQP